MRGYANRMQRQHDHDAFMMWHGAYLSIPKAKGYKFPPLKDFLYSSVIKKPVKGVDEDAIKARMMAYNRRLEQHG